MPASWAIAGRCKAALVEPPVAATIAAAFSRLARVTSSRGSGPPRARIAITVSPARRASAGRVASSAGAMVEPGSARPSASNWPAQAPMVGRQARSSASSSVGSIAPVMTAPTAS